MDLINSIELLSSERKMILLGVEDLSDEQLLKIPSGFKNNILWNLGHLVVTQQVLHYTLTRNELKIPKEMVSLFRTGTAPDTWNETPDIEQIKSLLIELPKLLVEDFQAGKFSEFRAYKTSTGFQLNTFEDAVNFNHFHEGAHTGIILSQKKFI